MFGDILKYQYSQQLSDVDSSSYFVSASFSLQNDSQFLAKF